MTVPFLSSQRVRDFYLDQINKAQRKVTESKARMEALRKALEAANDALTDISTLLIKVPETSNNDRLKAYASSSGGRVEFGEALTALLRYQLVIATLLYPAPRTPGTSLQTVRGRERASYNPPFTGVRLPDLAHLQAVGIGTGIGTDLQLPSFLRPPAELSRMSDAVFDQGGPTAYWTIDPNVHDGASISKTVKVLQAEIQALNQAFQMESSDATSALSTENSIREGSKTAMDKSFRVLADILGMRA
ncbi:MAG: 2-hydroxyacyl-CoA dehydratase family protein [Ramlibacter sp.]|jgi:hypothetical protein